MHKLMLCFFAFAINFISFTVYFVSCQLRVTTFIKEFCDDNDN